MRRGLWWRKDSDKRTTRHVGEQAMGLEEKDRVGWKYQKLVTEERTSG